MKVIKAWLLIGACVLVGCAAGPEAKPDKALAPTDGCQCEASWDKPPPQPGELTQQDIEGKASSDKEGAKEDKP